MGFIDKLSKKSYQKYFSNFCSKRNQNVLPLNLIKTRVWRDMNLPTTWIVEYNFWWVKSVIYSKLFIANKSCNRTWLSMSRDNRMLGMTRSRFKRSHNPNNDSSSEKKEFLAFFNIYFPKLYQKTIFIGKQNILF